jgi:Restriction endonuclease
MKAWEKYQHDTADLLRELGFTAVVNDQLTEPNETVHAVDVSARRTVGGVGLLWIIECKLWNRRVPKEKVATLKAIVDGVGADRGLVMSQTGFQAGAVQMAIQKNITLSSLEDLRANAGEELLAARVEAMEQRVRTMTQKLIRDLRTFSAGGKLPHILPIMASRLSADDWAELAGQAEAPDFFPGVRDMARRIGVAGIGDFVPPGTDLSDIKRIWKDGVDPAVMDTASREIAQITQALDQGKLDNWPIVCLAADGAKLAWEMRQLLGVIESRLVVLEQMVAREEGKATQ